MLQKSGLIATIGVAVLVVVFSVTERFGDTEQTDFAMDQEKITAIQQHYRALGVPSPDPSELRQAFYPERLNLPTMMQKIDDYWFVVDSYNNRVIYSDQLTKPIADWKLLDGDLSRPHSIVGNNNYLLVDDTEAHSLRLYRSNGSDYKLVDIFVDAGARPHRVWYDSKADRYFALAAVSQEFLEFTVESDHLVLKRRDQIAAIRGRYTRSFRIIDSMLWLFASNGEIVVVDHNVADFLLQARYRVPSHLASLNDVVVAGNYWYLSATRNQLARCKAPASDSTATLSCADLGPDIPYKGNPYLFSTEGDQLYLGVVAGQDTIFSFDLSAEGKMVRWKNLFPRKGNMNSSGRVDSATW